ncbi:UNVERIFIED_CONTAM: Vacuolar sorting protein 3 [Sesamum angustifolium]|uniref:Vacuolar sorting protein 3 n=1 Tax=Sesamum angustifolium TaxID=2727405 RepID=A0AAW2QQM7_9LAMI
MASSERIQSKGRFFAAMTSGLSLFSNAMHRSVNGLLRYEGVEVINPEGEKENAEEEEQRARWKQEIADINQVLAVQILISEKRTNLLSPDEVIAAIDPKKVEILQRYLQWLIEDQDSDDSQFHTAYALVLAKSALATSEVEVSAQDSAGGIPENEIKVSELGRTSIFASPVRERFQTFLQSSDLYDAEEVLDMIEESELWLEKLVHNLSRALDIDASLARLEQRSRHVQINDESICDSCHARLGTKLFAMYPDDAIVCYKCFRRQGESTSVSGRDFKKEILVNPVLESMWLLRSRVLIFDRVNRCVEYIFHQMHTDGNYMLLNWWKYGALVNRSVYVTNQRMVEKEETEVAQERELGILETPKRISLGNAVHGFC